MRTSQFERLVGYPSGQRGQTVNLLAHAFDGSNPSPTTIPFFVHCEPKHCLTAAVTLLALTATASVSPPLPSATNVLNRVIDRSSHLARLGNYEKYSYAKR